MTYLLDTSVIADLISSNPNPGLVSWIDSEPEEMLFLSVATLAELKQSIESVKSPQKKAIMNEWLNNDLLVRFSGRISEITVEATLKWGELSAQIHGKNRSINSIDALNLAISLMYNHILVTKHPHVFEETGVQLFNPFSI